MPVPVLYPKVSLEMQTGRIARWLVADGVVVSAGQVIFEIDNDKAAVEVESPAAGTLRHAATEGVEVDVGASVAHILVSGETMAPDIPSMVTTGTVMAEPDTRQPNTQTVVPAPKPRSPNPTPLARRIAREQGVSLAGLAGSGPRGRVQKSDVIARLEALASAPALPVEGAGLNAVWLRRGTGIPVVLLHGYSADLNNWRGLFAGARTDFPALAIDLPAHGASPRATPTDADALCAQIEAAVLALHEGPVVVAGHSFGGAISARLAGRGRLDLRGLCLFAPAGLGPEIDEAFTRGILRAKNATSLRPWLERLVYDPAGISEAFVKAVAEARLDAGLTAAMEAFAERFFPDGTQALSVHADLAQLQIPAKAIFGRQDRILPFATTRSLPATIGLHAVDACGHLPHLEHPALALRLLHEVWRSAG